MDTTLSNQDPDFPQVLPVEPELLAYFARAAKAGGALAEEDRFDWEKRRVHLERIAAALSPPRPSTIRVDDVAIPATERSVLTRLYRPVPAPSSLPLVLFFHGGGWVFGSVETHDFFAAMMAEGAGCAVLSVEYRLAPENAYEDALADCLLALEWARINAERLGIDPERIGVCGDSAGGHLAACVASRAGADGAGLRCQLLVYPMISPDGTTPSHRLFSQAPGLSAAEAEAFWRSAFAGRDVGSLPVEVLPARMAPESFPPSYVLTAEFDPLRDEGEAFADGLTAAGVHAVLRRAPALTHGFIRAAPYCQAAADELQTAWLWLEDRLNVERKREDGPHAPAGGMNKEE